MNNKTWEKQLDTILESIILITTTYVVSGRDPEEAKQSFAIQKRRLKDFISSLLEQEREMTLSKIGNVVQQIVNDKNIEGETYNRFKRMVEKAIRTGLSEIIEEIVRHRMKETSIELNKKLRLVEYRCDDCGRFFWVENSGKITETMNCPFCENGTGWLNDDKISLTLNKNE